MTKRQMRKLFKKIVGKSPWGLKIVKTFYDWRQQKKLTQRISSIVAAENLPFEKEAPEKYSVGYEPTIRCNLRCKMCYQGQTRALRQSELSEEELIEVFKKLEPKLRKIKFVGGEPMIRQDIFGMISFWDKAGKKVILQSNCTLINENNIGELKKYKNVSDVLTSLDGPPEIHDMIRGVPGSFEKMKKAVSLIRENMPWVSFSAFATLVPDNIDSLFSLIDTAENLGFSSINLLFEQVYLPEDETRTKRVLKEIFGWEEGSYRLNTQIRFPLFAPGFNAREFKEKLSAVREYGFKKGCFVNFVPFDYYLNPEYYLGSPSSGSGVARRPFCLKLLAPELRINQKGEVIWCDVIEKSFGSLLEKTPDEIWLSPEFQSFRKFLHKNYLPICRRCCKANYIE